MEGLTKCCQLLLHSGSARPACCVGALWGGGEGMGLALGEVCWPPPPRQPPVFRRGSWRPTGAPLAFPGSSPPLSALISSWLHRGLRPAGLEDCLDYSLEPA